MYNFWEFECQDFFIGNLAYAQMFYFYISMQKFKIMRAFAGIILVLLSYNAFAQKNNSNLWKKFVNASSDSEQT